MFKIGITGQSGFLGSHLYNTIALYPDKFIRIPFKDDFFQDISIFNEFVSQCDVIVHLAAVNRHNDPEIIYNTNIDLVKRLIESLDQTGHNPHIIFSSSIQEDFDTPYGRSKREGREILANWCHKKGSIFTGLIFPNIFGSFGNPYYNSFIATFCHQLTHSETPKIDADKKILLIYVAEAVKIIIDAILERDVNKEYRIVQTSDNYVSDILNVLNNYKSFYFEKGIFPELNDEFEHNLFNTFRSYINLKQHNPVKLILNNDERGSFIEAIKTNIGGQLSFSTTKPGITRGNHFHTRKIERFTVIKGKSRIQLRRIGTEEILDFYLSGDEPSYIDMPIWYTHNITNIGDEDLYTLFWVDEFFDKEDTDTYFEEV